MKSIIPILTFFFISIAADAQLKMTFTSSDGVQVTADWYPVNSESMSILLCHQKGYSRGEYLETAKKLNMIGFNCLAIDQRGGKEINGIVNETALEAQAAGKAVDLLSAELDMLAAVEWLFEKYKRRIIIIGSSYSASLALKIAKENDHVFAVAAFSPGEHFDDKTFIAKKISGLQKPVYLTSSKAEAPAVTELTKDVMSMIKVQYIPRGQGDHGSKVLWSSGEEQQDYWAGLMSFLNRMSNTKYE